MIGVSGLLAALLGWMLGEVPAESVERRVTLAAVGDIQTNLNLRKPEELPGGDPFILVLDALAADLTVGNLEGPVALDGREPAQNAHGPILQQPPYIGDLLARAGFDLVSLANNHALDWGVDGLLDTVEVVRTAGVVPSGAWEDPTDRFQPDIVSVNGVTVGFLAYTMWLNVANMRGAVGLGNFRLDDVEGDIAALRPYVDFVVVQVHWERENDHFAYGNSRDLVRRMIDAGADVILGHHAHVLKGFEWYRGGLVAYSLGNFVFGFQSGAKATSAVLRMTLVRRADGTRALEDVGVVPVVLEGPRSIPKIATPSRRVRIVRLLSALSYPLGAWVTLDGSIRPLRDGTGGVLPPRVRRWIGE